MLPSTIMNVSASANLWLSKLNTHPTRLLCTLHGRRRRRPCNTRYRAARYGLTRAGLPPAGTRQLRLAHHNIDYGTWPMAYGNNATGGRGHRSVYPQSVAAAFAMRLLRNSARRRGQEAGGDDGLRRQPLRTEIGAVVGAHLGGVRIPVPQIEADQRPVVGFLPSLEERLIEARLQHRIEDVGGAAERLARRVRRAFIAKLGEQQRNADPSGHRLKIRDKGQFPCDGGAGEVCWGVGPARDEVIQRGVRRIGYGRVAITADIV